jgi:hypothetical protein
MAGPQPNGIFLARPEEPFEGKRLAVKDLFDTAGLTTTYGSVIYADHVPERSAEAVTRLEAAGYANVGKTNLHEFAYGITSVNPHFGTVPNPRYPGRMAGGSSGGSAAAIAAGLAEYALGTDSGGSIRIAAACCGIVGFKPSYGLVSLDGVFPLAPSFDHAGPMAGSVGACEEMLEELADGYEPARLDSLEELEVGARVARLSGSSGRARVRRRRSCSRGGARSTFARGADRARVHARGRRRPPRPVRRVRRLLRRQRADEDRAPPGAHRRRVPGRVARPRRARGAAEEALEAARPSS